MEQIKPTEKRQSWTESGLCSYCSAAFNRSVSHSHKHRQANTFTFGVKTHSL